MKWLLIGLFVIGALCANAWFGSTEPRQKRVYGIAALALWALVFVLANAAL